MNCNLMCNDDLVSDTGRWWTSPMAPTASTRSARSAPRRYRARPAMYASSSRTISTEKRRRYPSTTTLLAVLS